MPILYLRAAHVAQLATLAARPVEVCGLIGGGVTGDGYFAEQIIPVPNTHPQPEIAYEMARREMAEGIMTLRRAGQTVVALYHSHPFSLPIPSESDLALATWPDAVYLILGHAAGGNPVLGAWLIRAGSAQAVRVSSEG